MRCCLYILYLINTSPNDVLRVGWLVYCSISFWTCTVTFENFSEQRLLECFAYELVGCGFDGRRTYYRILVLRHGSISVSNSCVIISVFLYHPSIIF